MSLSPSGGWCKMRWWQCHYNHSFFLRLPLHKSRPRCQPMTFCRKFLLYKRRHDLQILILNWIVNKPHGIKIRAKSQGTWRFIPPNNTGSSTWPRPSHLWEPQWHMNSTKWGLPKSTHYVSFCNEMFILERSII